MGPDKDGAGCCGLRVYLGFIVIVNAEFQSYSAVSRMQASRKFSFVLAKE